MMKITLLVGAAVVESQERDITFTTNFLVNTYTTHID